MGWMLTGENWEIQQGVGREAVSGVESNPLIPGMLGKIPESIDGRRLRGLEEFWLGSLRDLRVHPPVKCS
jgi:hypothetical protein